MTHIQQQRVNEILAGISNRGIDVTPCGISLLPHGNVKIEGLPQGFPEIVVGFRGGVEAIGYRARYGFSSDVQVAVHADVIALQHAPKPYVRPTPKTKGAGAHTTSKAQETPSQNVVGLTDEQLPEYQME